MHATLHGRWARCALGATVLPAQLTNDAPEKPEPQIPLTQGFPLKVSFVAIDQLDFIWGP